MTTEFQILANQQNARLSTGPKDTSKTSKNAEKYGIFSKNLIIDCKYYKEDQKGFEKLREGFYQEYEPKSQTEIILVDKVIETCWRLMRIGKARDAMIIESMERAKFDSNRRVEDVNDCRRMLSKNVLNDGWEYRSEEEINKQLTEISDKTDRLAFGDMSEEEIDKELDVYAMIANHPQWNKSKNISLDEKKQILSESLEKVYDICNKPLKDKEKHKRFMEKVELARCLVVPDITNQNLSAYETALEKKFYRALMMLRQIKKENLY